MNDTRPSAGHRATITRRHALQLGVGGLVVAGTGTAGTLAWRHNANAAPITPTSPEVGAAEQGRAKTGKLVTRKLVAQPTTIDLAGREAKTWGFGDGVPTSAIRASLGDQLRVDLSNHLPVATTIHWHGLALRNDMDGVPGVTMAAIQPGSSFRYQFTLPHPGTFWFHPHVGVQLDTGMLGALIIEDPAEPLAYDDDVVLVLDDWTDGISASPDTVLAGLAANGMPGMGSSGGMGGMGGMNDSGGMGTDDQHPLGQDTGDVRYPLHLINGKPPKDPTVVTTKPAQRLRLRLVNAGSDTAYRFAIGGHRLRVVAADGYPVQPVDVDTLLLGMGERYDVIVTAQSGAFPIIAVPEGKPDQRAFAVLRSGSGTTPAATAPELSGRRLTYADLQPTAAVALPTKTPDRTLDVGVQMGNGGREWLINGKTYADHLPLDVRSGERVRLRLQNQTMMFHPMHLHGHTFALVTNETPGVRKDTINVLPMQTLEVDLHADNPGQWLLHCHNAYHGELGMMTVMSYVR